VLNVERFVRNRFVRLGLALTLVSLGGFAYAPYLTYRVAASAFVNAELIRVTAPMAGRLARTMPHKGVFLDHATSVTLIEALSPDRRQLLNLERQYALAKENGELARRQLHEIAAIDFELGVRAEAYRRGIVDRLGLEVAEAEAERVGCIAEFRQRQEVATRTEALKNIGLASVVRSADVLATEAAASTRCEMAVARLGRIRVELESAKNGVFLRDGTNDVPYSQQQRDRLVLRRQELETQILQETSRTSQLAAEIAAERDRIERLESYSLALPANHVVWSTAASPGSSVTEGQTILDLADCEHQFVVVELPERDFEQIKTGDVAAVRLIGGNEWQQGRVQQIRGSAARSDDRLFAAQVPSANHGTITVEVSIPSDSQSITGSNSCGIGRLAEVRFRRDLFGIETALTNGVRWLANRLPYRTARNTAAGR
jgi:multidrug resistance efflux pump